MFPELVSGEKDAVDAVGAPRSAEFELYWIDCAYGVRNTNA